MTQIEPLTRDQIERLEDLASMQPLKSNPIDQSLAGKKLVIIYPEDFDGQIEWCTDLTDSGWNLCTELAEEQNRV